MDEHAQEALPVVVGQLPEALLLREGAQLLGETPVEAGGADREAELVGDEREEPDLTSGGNGRGSREREAETRDDLVARRGREG